MNSRPTSPSRDMSYGAAGFKAGTSTEGSSMVDSKFTNPMAKAVGGIGDKKQLEASKLVEKRLVDENEVLKAKIKRLTCENESLGRELSNLKKAMEDEMKRPKASESR